MKQREFVKMPLVIMVLCCLVYLCSWKIAHPWLRILFPQSNNGWELSKVFFTAFLILYLGLFIFGKEVINNQLLSRVVALICMLIVSMVFFYFFSLKGRLEIIIIMIGALFCGQGVCYLIQKVEIKNSDSIALIAQTLLTFFLTFFCY